MSTVCCTDIALECIHPISVSSGEMTEWRFSSKALKSHRHLIMFYLVTHSFYFPSSLVRSIREVQIFFSFTHNYWMLLNNSLASSCCSVLQILAKSSRKKKKIQFLLPEISLTWIQKRNSEKIFCQRFEVS